MKNHTKAFEEIIKDIQPTDGTKYALLTPDDILTLRLLRDDYQSSVADCKHRSHRYFEIALDTLNRILKQVE